MSNIKALEEMRGIAKQMDDVAAMQSEHGFSPLALKAKGIADKIEAEIAERFMELPVDADGVPIRPGDKVYGYGRKEDGMTVRFIDQHGNLMVGDTGTTNLRDCLYWTAENVIHHKPDTVESVLEEFGRILVPENAQDGLPEFVERYAERIRKAVDR